MEICVLAPEKAAPGGLCRPRSTALRDQVADQSPSVLSTERRRSILIFANQSSGEGRPTSAFSDAPIMLSAAFPGESADSSPISLWSELGRSRWSLPEHTIRISSLCLFWSPASRLTQPSHSVPTWGPPGDLHIACGWRLPRSQWEAEYGRCTSLPCSPLSCRHR